jgi:hypothetical protein
MEYLEKVCPADWSSDETAIEDNISKMRGKWKEVWGAMGEKEYGLGAPNGKYGKNKPLPNTAQTR